ncbi:MAG: RluA family pseudouridine synthase [Wenzhouxiangellaceae bacterium]|nr:RluA family pseudouridine synthase [Wenzhouxiangellaceae bacterium]
MSAATPGAAIGDRISLQAVVTDSFDRKRLDQVAASLWPEYSRSRLADWIRAGKLQVNGCAVKPNFRLSVGDRLALETVIEPHDSSPGPEAMALEVLHVDDELMVINKPPGLVVHPGSGNLDGTLVNGLLFLEPGLASLPRAGLIHRLDKDTSGCLVIARTSLSHLRLVEALKRREIHRHYQAIVWGHMIAGGQVNAALGRHPVDRRRQVVRGDGRPAITHYRVKRHLAGATLLDVKLETGRTHQIRVHMQHIGFPLVGDLAYGRRGSPSGLDEQQRQAWRSFGRQALHARQIELKNPVSGELISVSAPLPDDMQQLIEVLDGPA